MKYADRYGNRWEKTGFQDRFLEKLYKSVPGRAVVKVLVHPWVSRMGGWILSQKASCWLIPLFLKGFLYEKAEIGTTSGGRRYGADHQSL